MVRPQSNCEKQSNPNNQEFDQQFYLPIRMKLHPTYLLILLSFELCIAKHLQQQDAGNRGEYTVACLRGHWQFKHFTWCHLTLHAIIRFIATVGSPWFFYVLVRIFCYPLMKSVYLRKKRRKTWERETEWNTFGRQWFLCVCRAFCCFHDQCVCFFFSLALVSSYFHSRLMPTLTK